MLHVACYVIATDVTAEHSEGFDQAFARGEFRAYNGVLQGPSLFYTRRADSLLNFSPGYFEFQSVSPRYSKVAHLGL